MASITIQVVESQTGKPASKRKVWVRSLFGDHSPYSEFIDSDGMIDVLFIDPGLAEVYVGGTLIQNIDIGPDSKARVFGGKPFVVKI
jgi:hypothetical protein